MKAGDQERSATLIRLAVVFAPDSDRFHRLNSTTHFGINITVLRSYLLFSPWCSPCSRHLLQTSFLGPSLIDRPFRVATRSIWYHQFLGDVVDIGAAHPTTWDNRLVIVPNSQSARTRSSYSIRTRPFTT
jgi:hypothetical protein